MSFETTWMDLKIIILSEKKSERKRQISYDTTYKWNLKYDANKFIYKTETDSQRKKPYCYQWGGGR